MLTDAQIAAQIDLSRHVNEPTGEIGDVLTSALSDELGPERFEEAQDLAMACLARVVSDLGGQEVRISARSTTSTAIRKDRAKSLLSEGASRQEAMRKTSLSRYHVTQAQEELDEVCSAGVLGASPAKA